jgi:nucleotide-binding universal stress UspA family protein
VYSSILFPIDLEHESSWKKALPVVKTLAKSFGAPVHVMTAVAEVREHIQAEFFPPDFENQIVGRARERIGAFVQSNMGDVGKVDAYVEVGRPYKAIIAAADRIGCDLIVMASHRPEMIDLLIGPNADSVVRHAKQSVLVVRD